MAYKCVVSIHKSGRICLGVVNSYEKMEKGIVSVAISGSATCNESIFNYERG